MPRTPLLSRLAVLCLLGLTGLAHGQLTDPIATEAGLLRGASGDAPDIRVYKGIPYAAPPVGQNRWRAPQPVPAWAGVRFATDFAPRCIQRGFEVGADQPLTSEDCLYLNVWTPAGSPSAGLPVMIWIHGGGFFAGAGSDISYDGENLASAGAVVVTINYRLGSFGFLAHPELSEEAEYGASGNYALLDMIQALEWVRDNIEAFGGDPGNVTIVGESAGANAVANLIASPLAEGLFQRAIAQSGGWMGLSMDRVPTLEEQEQAGAEQVRAFGAESIDQLRQASSQAIFEHFPSGGSVVVDGYFLPRDPSLIFADGMQNPVDVLAGSNRDEAVFFGPGIREAQAMRNNARERFAGLAGDYLAHYPADSDEQAAQSYQQSFNDELAWQMRRLGAYQREQGQDAWIYFFTRVPPGQEERGATHVAELAYMFNQHDQNANWTATDRRLGEIMASYWVNFAQNGDPNGSGLPEWPRYEGDEPGNVLVLGDEVRAQSESVPGRDELEFFDRVYQRQLER